MSVLNLLSIRIKGRVGIIEEPIEHKDKWAFTLYMCDISGENCSEIRTIGPFDSEQQAKDEMMVAVKIAADTAAGQNTDQYLDLKNGGVLRPWRNDS